MNQFYSHYENWEDFKNGMYCISKQSNEKELINNAIVILSDNDMFFETCKELLQNWPISIKVNLTNRQCNRKAWLGQAACSYKFNVPEILTRISWNKLSKIKQFQADQIALKIINYFELTYENKNKELRF